MTSKEMMLQILEEEKWDICNVIGVLSNIIEEKSEFYWTLGQCQRAKNYFYTQMILDSTMSAVDIDEIVTEDWERKKNRERLIKDLEDMTC